jgi:hypothetical protein
MPIPLTTAQSRMFFADCDSSPEKPEINNSLETEISYSKKNRESKCRMLKHMLIVK